MIIYEGDPRYVDLLLRYHGLGAEGRQYLGTSPRFRQRTRLQELTCQLTKSRYVRNLFIVLDRPDAQFASKAINRAMAQPTTNEDETLKELARFHLTAPRLLLCYLRQPKLFKIVGLGDTNGAACRVTRESLGCTHLMLGGHPIFAGSTRQAVICRQDQAISTLLYVEHPELRDWRH